MNDEAKLSQKPVPQSTFEMDISKNSWVCITSWRLILLVRMDNVLKQVYLIYYSGPYKTTLLHSLLCKVVTDSWLEGYSQPNLGALFNCPGIHFTRYCEKGFWSPLVLDESTCLTIAVNPSLHRGQWVQQMLCPDGQRVLVAWEAVSQLCPNSCICHRLHSVVVGSTKGITLVIPV